MDIGLLSITFIHNFAAGFVMPWMGLLLIYIRPDIKRIAFIALLYGFLGVLLRVIVDLSWMTSFYIQILGLIAAVWLLSGLGIGLFKSFVATILGIIILAVGETISINIIQNIFEIDYQSSRLSLLLTPLPQISMALIIIRLCYSRHFRLVDLSGHGIINALTGKRSKRVKSIVIILLSVMVFQMSFTSAVIFQKLTIFKQIPLPLMVMASAIVLILGMIAILLLITQLLELTEKESQYYAQEVYIDTLDEMYSAIRSERHDIINHMQTIYGFNQLGYTDEVQSYIRDLLGGNVFCNEHTVVGSPGLTALFFMKSGVAKNNNIELNIVVEKQIKNLNISPYELNNILGNLINNAFDAVMPLEKNQKIVNIFIGGDDKNYVFKVSNYGYIDEHIKQNIFKKGFSTKKAGHSGLGLHICESMVKKHGGALEINNINEMVELSVLIPIQEESAYLTKADDQNINSIAS